MGTQFNETSLADINLVINDDDGGGVSSRRLRIQFTKVIVL